MNCIYICIMHRNEQSIFMSSTKEKCQGVYHTIIVHGHSIQERRDEMKVFPYSKDESFQMKTSKVVALPNLKNVVEGEKTLV
jgi:hypothetical protein